MLRINIKELISDLDKRIKNLVANSNDHSWYLLLKIFYENPKQLIKYFHLVQNQFLKNIEDFSEVFVPQEKSHRYLGLNRAYKFFFEIIKYKKNYFKQEFINLLIDEF